MTTDYVVEAEYHGGMHFSGTVGGHPYHMDYPLRPGDALAGPKPMEMLLASLASCAGGSTAALMRRSGQPMEGLTVTARARRRVEHPTVFTEIALEFVFHGALDTATVAKVLSQVESQICPIWAMLKPTTLITSSFRIVAGVPASEGAGASY